jgi:hypothetical protein
MKSVLNEMEKRALGEKIAACIAQAYEITDSHVGGHIALNLKMSQSTSARFCYVESHIEFSLERDV